MRGTSGLDLAEAARRTNYHVQDAPTISDAEYDALMRRRRSRNRPTPVCAPPTVPPELGVTSSTDFQAVDHLERMLSLDNSITSEELWPGPRASRVMRGAVHGT